MVSVSRKVWRFIRLGVVFGPNDGPQTVFTFFLSSVNEGDFFKSASFYNFPRGSEPGNVFYFDFVKVFSYASWIKIKIV